MTTDKERAYSRGYQAGRKYIERAYSREIASERREEFRRAAALSVLASMMLPGNNWGKMVDGQHRPYTSMDEYAKAAFLFADKLCDCTAFSGRVEIVERAQ